MITPLNDYVLLAYSEKKDKQDGIILSDISRDKQSTAVVVAVGPECEKLQKGQTIIFNPFVVREIKVDGQKLYIIREKDCYAIYERD